MNRSLLHIAGFIALAALSPLAFAATDSLDPATSKTAPVKTDAPASVAKEPDTLWLVRCDDLKEKGKYCEAFQNLSMKDEKSEKLQRVTEVAIGYTLDKKKKAQAVIILPLGVLVTDKVKLSVDDKSVADGEIRFCQPNGCYAFTEISDSVLDKMGKGQKLKVEGKAATGQPLEIILGLKGFAKAMEQLRS